MTETETLVRDIANIEAALLSDEEGSIGRSLTDDEVRGVRSILSTRNPRAVYAIARAVLADDVHGLIGIAHQHEVARREVARGTVRKPVVRRAPPQPDWSKMSFFRKLREALRWEPPKGHTWRKELSMLVFGDELH